MKKLAILLLIFSISTPILAKQAAIIIDIDDTIMDTRGRTHEILLEVGAANNIPELATLELEKTHFSCHKTCGNVGMLDEQVITQVCGDRKGDTESGSLWGRKFFLDEAALRYDHVMPGSVSFLRKIAQEIPVHIVYLSGRKEKYMLQTTKQQLAFHNFPIAKPGDKFSSEFILKPESATNNVEFKRQVIRNLQEKYNVVFAIDDNLKNVNLFREMLGKNAIVVRLNHDVTDVDGMADNIQQITNFYFNVKNKGDSKAIQANNAELDKIYTELITLVEKS